MRNTRIECLDDYRAFLDADLSAHGVRKWHPWLAITHPELHYQRLLRRTEYASTLKGITGKLAWAFCRFRLARASVRTGISIPPGVFGAGLSIAHFGSIVVNNEAVVGEFCRIHSATNIGTYRGQAPVIGDYVYIGPGAVIYGAATIGSRAVVGANSVVTGAVPDGATVAGTQIRQGKDSARVMPTWITELMN